jgi:hypothetical protein
VSPATMTQRVSQSVWLYRPFLWIYGSMVVGMFGEFIRKYPGLGYVLLLIMMTIVMVKHRAVKF